MVQPINLAIIITSVQSAWHSFTYSAFYFTLGIFLTLYFIIVLRKTNKKNFEELESKSIIKFYLNIFVLNKDEALKTVIQSKMANKSKFAIKLVTKLAKNLVTDEQFTSKVADRIKEAIPLKLSDMGIKASVDIAYCYGSYVCMDIDVVTADARKVIEKRAGKDKLDNFDNILGLFGMPQLNNTIDDTLAGIIGEKMQENLPNILREKMRDRVGLQVKVVACSEAEQGTFFIRTLKELQEANKAN